MNDETAPEDDTDAIEITLLTAREIAKTMTELYKSKRYVDLETDEITDGFGDPVTDYVC